MKPRILLTCTLLGLLLCATSLVSPPATASIITRTANSPAPCGGAEAGDAGSTWDTAQPITRPSTCSGSLGWHPGDFQDWYRVDLPVASLDQSLAANLCLVGVNDGETYVLFTLWFRSALDAALGNPPGRMTDTVEVYTCEWHGAAAPLEAALGGTWYVRLRSEWDGVVINYRLRVE